MPKDSFVIKVYSTMEEREAGGALFGEHTVDSLAEFDRIFKENDEAGKYFAYESSTGTKMKYEACRFFLKQQEKEAQHS